MAGPGVKKQSEAALILERFLNLGGKIEIETKYDINVEFPFTQFVVCFGFFLILILAVRRKACRELPCWRRGGQRLPTLLGQGDW